MTKQEAIKLSDSKFWETLSSYDKVKFQLFEPKLCMPFDVFHAAVESNLGRPVYTHEFTSRNIERLQKEFLGEEESPT